MTTSQVAHQVDDSTVHRAARRARLARLLEVRAEIGVRVVIGEAPDTPETSCAVIGEVPLPQYHKLVPVRRRFLPGRKGREGTRA